MANKQVLINEIEALPANYIDEILQYVLSLKRRGPSVQTIPDEDVTAISRRLMEQNKEAYEVLAR